jgi:4-hydroxy-3-polyprenylbenzoate decarboxylase
MRLAIGISGASGVMYGVKLLEFLRNEKNVETFLIVTKAAEKVIEVEMGLPIEHVLSMANHHYDVNDLTAPLVSGSFPIDKMVIIPCSMRTLAAIAQGRSDNLLLRAADVTLKEGRQLVLVPRETPLNVIHLENMLKLARLGVTILPAMPAFYIKPTSLDDLFNYVVGKVLDVIGVQHDLYKRWRT